MTVDPAEAAGEVVFAGTTYYFCSGHCQKLFQIDPAKYLAAAGARQSSQQSAPVPHQQRTRDLQSKPAITGAYMTRRSWFGAALSRPVLFVALADMLSGQLLHGIASPRGLTWLQFLLSTPVVLWCGWPFFQCAWASLINRRPNMFTLGGMGIGTAFGYSLAATLVPDWFPAAFLGHGGAIGVYFEAAAVITTLVLLGQVLELRARSRTSEAIRALLV